MVSCFFSPKITTFNYKTSALKGQSVKLFRQCFRLENSPFAECTTAGANFAVSSVSDLATLCSLRVIKLCARTLPLAHTSLPLLPPAAHLFKAASALSEAHCPYLF